MTDYQLIATVLIEAAFTTDDSVCERYGVSRRSVQRWRKMLLTDDALAQVVATKKQKLDEKWAESVPGALRHTIEFLGESARKLKADPNAYRNPMLIEAMAGAMKLCADVFYTGRVIDARIAAINRETDNVSGSVSTQADNSLASQSVQ